jgi:proteasome maturation protein
MKMEGLRRAYGIAEPVRRGMELKIVRDGTFRPAVLGGMRGGNVHEDILMIGGRDAEVQWEDIYTGMFLCLFLWMVMGVWIEAFG